MNTFPIESKFDFAAQLNTAVALHRAGELGQAAGVYSHILALMPDQPDALHLMGVIQRQRGDYPGAEKLINQAIQCDSGVPIYHVSLGDVFQAAGELKTAVQCYQEALRLKPDLVEALCNLGNAWREQGDFQQAIDCYQKGLAVNPASADLYNNLGLAHYQENKSDSALACFKKAIGLSPDFADAYNNLGNVYREQLNFDDAVQQYRQALALSPDNAAVNHNLGIVLQMQQKIDQARVYYQRTIDLNPVNPGALNNLGKLYHDSNQLDQAIRCYQKAIQLEPAHADAHFNCALSLLMKGEFSAGWQEYEWRFKRKKWRKIYPHRLKGPRWDGTVFKGRRLLVHSEQGFGDVIQFIRYLPRVKTLGGDVIFEVRPELKDLLQNYDGIDQLSTLSFDSPPLEAYDYHVPLMTLPKLFGTSSGSIPARVPYLHASPAKVEFWQDRFQGTDYNIGLVWGAKTTYQHNKTCPLELWLPLLNIARARFYGLQKGSAASQMENLPVAVENLGQEFESFADTAGVIANLDLVISVDTSVAHLAGAMGKPVWVLLPYAPDWRWLLNREDSPWYPSMRLFRQPRQGDWQSVVDRIGRHLVERLQSRSKLF